MGAQQAARLRAAPYPASKACAQGMIITRTPLRISFGGGGTDLPGFYDRERYGMVFSSAIDKYVYVTVKRHSEVFFESIRLNYSATEQCEKVSDIGNNIIRECLRFMNIDPPIYVSTVADLPASSGLGGSSAFTVGLLHALHAFRGERVPAGQLAEEACHIEIDVLKQPIGKQDQYAAAFGGLNLFRFHPGGAVSVEPQYIPTERLKDLFEQILMFWTGIGHDSGAILREQNGNLASRRDKLIRMRAHARELLALTSNGSFDPGKFGRVLHEGWSLKRQLASSISGNQIDAWYEAALAAGAEGGKLCGAGGGGFLLLMVRRERQDAVRRALNLVEVPVGCEVHGSRVVLSSGDA